MRLLSSLQACALAACLCGCVTVPTLYGSPEDIAERIGGNAVAYNQSYGRAIANQVLLNTLRARDRLPLYHLSMSGITDGSYTDVTGQAQIGSIGLGQGNANWGVGQVQSSRTNRTLPAYTLNPFGGTKDNSGTSRQFAPISSEGFLHYWRADWPRETLLYLMVDSATDVMETGRVRYANSPSNMHVCNSEEGARYCSFIDIVRHIAEQEVIGFSACAAPANNSNRDDDCGLIVTIQDATYELEFRAVDDMIYYVGSTLRPNAYQPRVRPQGVYPLDPTDRNAWQIVDRSTPLFQVSTSPGRHNQGDYAAEISYRGERHVAGPANSNDCPMRTASDCEAERRAGDVSANVLSLLTRLVIMSQSQNTAGPQVLVVPPS
jgi:hypothetical protein